MTGEQGTLCTRCGASVAAGAYFCARCGTSIPIGSGDAGATVASASHALLDALRQATLGDYEVLAEVGHGGMATVYLAHDLALDRKVAIKVLEPALLLMGEGMAERFKREARTAAALSHPHIIPIYAVKESERVLYFVMKYVQGRPLDSVLRDVGALPIPMVQTIIAQVGDALAYAHRHGVIHRDIKSANIMLDEVIAVCGRPSLRHDAPVRGEMITLARAGGRSPALAQIKTPTSPLALSKSQTHPAPVAARSRHGRPRVWWALGVGAGAIVVAAPLWWGGPGRAAAPPGTRA